MRTWCKLSCFLVCFVRVSLGTPDHFSEVLFEQVAEDQVKVDQEYKPYIQWEKRKGMYSTDIVINFHGNPVMAFARRHLRIFDNNMFVTSWVMLYLLEAFKYGKAPRPSDEQLALSINALKDFQDKNQPYNTSVMTFWPQQYNNVTNHWDITNVNLFGFINSLDYLPLDLVEHVVKILDIEQIIKFIESNRNGKSIFLTSGKVAPHLDCAFVYLALGSELFYQKDEFPGAWKLWKSHNTNLTSVFDALKKYAYRPFSPDSSLNSIDPATYFYIRGFLDQAKSNGQDIALASTWVRSTDEVREGFHRGVDMPFQVNNIDVSKAAINIFGITSSVLNGLVCSDVLEDPLISQIYQNTSSLLAYAIRTNFVGRQDLALYYFPSRMVFYFFVARIVNTLESARRTGALPVEVMDTVFETLRDVVQGPMTKDILSMAKQERPGKVYFEDFLGNGDISLEGKPLKRGEDRIFTTAMTVNTLMNAWTYYNANSGKSRWIKGTHRKVKNTVTRSVKWLREHTLDGNYFPGNAFLSINLKGDKTLLYWYPGNRLEYINGTVITDRSTLPSSPFIYAVQGYVPPDQYDAMLKELKEKHFGVDTPMTFDGYNSGDDVFPIWSSASLTYSATLLAVSRFDHTGV